MDYTTAINSKIIAENGFALSILFNPKSNVAFQTLKNTNTTGLLVPFDSLMKAQLEFLLDKTYDKAEKVLEIFLDMVPMPWTEPIYRRILCQALRASTSVTDARLARILIRHQRNLKTTNALLFLYQRMDTPKLAEVLLATVTKRGLPASATPRDIVAFRYYQGRVLLGCGRFIEAREALLFVYKIRACRPLVAPYLYLASACCGFYPREPVMNRNGCNKMVSLIRGLRRGEPWEEDVGYYTSLGLLRHMKVTLPLIRMRNRIRIIYYLLNEDSKVRGIYLRNGIKDESISNDEWIWKLLNLIELGYIRGYLSLTKDIVVFSKIDPFPILNKI
ncbi:PCI domain-containing protein 2 like protein [Astathelohania contejeani]|uniref:PCI domain-containing protein 2 like protein n=1 Tax=Astathelohania contejeani TaxID=164912 RepID=A0ABQ7I0P6_9MICR|nr:PCI domain-containing protein 2 like protein [Thelohania contejeani]